MQSLVIPIISGNGAWMAIDRRFENVTVVLVTPNNVIIINTWTYSLTVIVCYDALFLQADRVGFDHEPHIGQVTIILLL